MSNAKLGQSYDDKFTSMQIGKLKARIAELEGERDKSMSVCPHLIISGLTKGMNRVYCASCDNEYWIPSKALGESDE